MNYQSVPLHRVFEISEVFSIHYFEYMRDFYFSGETHDFWEFLCVDKGEVNVTAGDRALSLKKDEIIFHKPNEFHNVQSNGRIAPNLVVISFACYSPAMAFFEEKILKINEAERVLLGEIIQEAKYAFEGRLNDPYQKKLIPAASPHFASEQLIGLYLEQFLISLFRRHTQKRPQTDGGLGKANHQRGEKELLSQIISYMESHINETLSIDLLCKANCVGRSQLQKLFRSQTQLGAMEYFSHMKIDLAKRMIRESCYNFTQIADYLGFSSIHYFSRQFKKTTGMTPSEYAASIMALSE
jgi:AraC-like DNA-binding protein